MVDFSYVYLIRLHYLNRTIEITFRTRIVPGNTVGNGTVRITVVASSRLVGNERPQCRTRDFDEFAISIAKVAV